MRAAKEVEPPSRIVEAHIVGYGHGCCAGTTRIPSWIEAELLYVIAYKHGKREGEAERKSKAWRMGTSK